LALDFIVTNGEGWCMGYAGGKGRLWRSIVALMPPHDVYIETHLGGGAILRNKRPALRSIGIDVDPAVIEAAQTWGVPDLTLHLGDAVKFLSSYAFTGRELLYVDPPYLSKTKRGRRYYRHEYSDEDHLELLATVATLGCPVMISGYPSEMYQLALEDWNHRDLVNVTHAGRRTERLWANFPFSPDLHDYEPVGADFRERERVRRKTARWRQRLAIMPELERRAILAALIQTPEVEPQFVDRLIRQRTETTP
jgi:DNA adenine methylase